ncbi:MAG TPA: LuxR C-terminal-related transcriptional regulator [Pyrinomonadaceae bacterium]|jgi:DNA-binding CsgD family transcriptional regulator|nr:LuxR C-terminal-related transcriptional regulator [Pyrinomonadaceae bacterium]
MFPQKAKIIGGIEPKTYPLGEKFEQPGDAPRLALVALSHTPVERRLYTAMLESLNGSAGPAENRMNLFTARSLMDLTGIVSLSTIRRGLEGLVTKFSIEREPRTNGNGTRDHASTYRVFTPEEVIARREERGMKSYEKETASGVGSRAFERVIQRVVENKNLSRREAQVALCCVEGLTNAEIGQRLLVTEQTVKFHLRHIFIKFGVRRRAELISRLLL